MIDTIALKTAIIDLAVSGNISSQFQAKDSVKMIIESLPSLSNKRRKLLVQNYDYGKMATLPSHWDWIRLGELSSYGDTPQKAKCEDLSGDTWILDLEDIKSGGQIVTKTRVNEKKFIGEKTVFKEGQVLYSKLRPYLKKVLVADENGISTPELISFDTFGGMVPQYIVYCLLSSFTDRAIEKRSYGIKMPRVDAGFMVNLPIPVPPVSEQLFIVNKIQAAFSQLDTIDELQEKYADNLTVLKSKLIDAAIEGKLTEQLPEDGTAEDLYQQIQEEKQKLISEGKIKKQKPLPEITEGETPFAIPDNWKWVYLGELFHHNTGKALNSKDSQGIPLEYITTSNVYWNRFELNELKKMLFTESDLIKCTVKKGDLLVCEGGDIGRSAIWSFDYEMRIQNHIHRLRSYGNIVCVKYYYYIMWLYKHTNKINGIGIGLQGFSSKRVHSLIVPLPPLAEQKRIVQKLDELLPLCEKQK